MILRKGVISCIRTNMCSCRSISISSIRGNEERKNLPSRKLFVDLTEKVYLDEQLSRSGRRPFEVMVENPVVVKNFFVAAVDGEIVQYPDVVPKDLADNLKKKNAKLMRYFQANDKVDAFNHDALKKLDVFGYNVPKKFNGCGYSSTYRTLLSEIEAHNFDLANALNAHRLACFLIFEHGTEEQYKKYLPKLATGELVGTVAFKESNWTENADLNTVAEYDDDEDEWCLNGTKSFVTNAANANLFIVIAQTQTSNRLGDMKSSLTIFLVDRSMPGVNVHENDHTIGFTNQAKVTFDDVILPGDSIISLAGTGQHIQQAAELLSRIHQGQLNLIQMKMIMQHMHSMVASTERETTTEEQTSEAITIREAIGKHSCSIFALESMLYLTTGIMDKYDNTNIDLETAIFKFYSEEKLMCMVSDLLNLVDARVTLTDHPLNYLIRNAFHCKFSEQRNQLKKHIGTEGMQYRLARLIEEVKVKKNKEFVIKNFMSEESLDGYEPEIRPTAKKVFDSIDLLRLSSSTFIEMHSRQEMARETEVQKLADAAACIYASYACLLRVDRSLKLKLANVEDECFIAQTICDKNSDKVKKMAKYIDDGSIATFEQYHELVSSLSLDKNIIFPVHPLTRIF